MSLIRLVYASHSMLTDDSRRAELDGILASARRRNAETGVTGFLLATQGAFAQVLEGRDSDVQDIYGRIAADPRHRDLRILTENPIAERRFPDWAMGVAEFDETTHFIFGLYGITPESDLPNQHAEALLDLAGELANRPG